MSGGPGLDPEVDPETAAKLAALREERERPPVEAEEPPDFREDPVHEEPSVS